MITVCRVIFIMCYFCHFTHSAYFVPSQAQFFLCSIIMKRKIWPVLNSSIEDALKERGENKNGEICSQRKNKNICYNFINCLDIILCMKPPSLIFLLSGPEEMYNKTFINWFLWYNAFVRPSDQTFLCPNNLRQQFQSSSWVWQSVFAVKPCSQ